MSLVEFPLEVIGEGDRNPKASSNFDDYLLVAVGKIVKENKSNLIWALQNSGGKKICILHIHIPAQTVPYSRYVSKEEVTMYHEEEKKEMLKTLDKYIQLCAKQGVIVEKLFIESDSIENGIIEVISKNKIARVVMGAAADNRYKKSMTQLKSQKAIYVDSNAPSFCHIWFVCKGYIVHTREGVKSPMDENGDNNFLISRSRTETEASDIKSDIYHDTDEFLTPRMSKESGFTYELPTISVFDPNRPSTSYDVIDASPSAPHLDNVYISSSPPSRLREMSFGDELYDRLEKVMEEAEKLREEAYLESVKRQKAEKETILVTRKVKAIENLYYEEHKRRKELEEKLAKEMEEYDILKRQHAEVLQEFRVLLVEKSSLIREIERSNLKVEELEENMSATIGLLDMYKKEQDDTETELGNVLLENELLRKQVARLDPTTTQGSRFFVDFTYIEILEATNNFNPSWKIGEDGFGDIYKGLLRHVEVAIKVSSSNSFQGPQEFQQEVEALSKLRHPHIVTLIGVCSEASALIYEYLPNGNLNDRLNCKGNTPPLSWQTRIRIATELCCVLMFLHSCQPESIIHGDLKPANILLDAYLSCKLINFGISQKIHSGEMTMNNTTRFYDTDSEDTFAYIDPEFLSSGELTEKSDVYSFGIVLLRLLTGKSSFGIIKEVKNALDMDRLNEVLDPSAGGWPFVQAKQLALLGLRCCEMQRKNRPRIEEDAWRVLQPMRVSSRGSSLANLGHDEYDHVPSYFMCPILQDVMKDPHIAADGFTYEVEALKGWLESGHDTSPMTNLKLQNLTLIPNHGLRSAIQEWLQQRHST